MYFLRHSHEREFELRSGLDHPTPLVPDVFQSGCDVDLFTTLGHSVQDHVDQNIRPCSADPITGITIK